MTPLVSAGCVACLLLGTVALAWAQKPSAFLHFQSVLVGEEVTLKCFHRGTGADFIFWYKQPLGQKPLLMSEYFDFKENGSFVDAFKNDPRFKLEANKDKNHLKISNVKTSDSATYYCISSDSYKFKYLEGFTVHVKDSTSHIQASVVQSSSENIHAGDYVTLNCTVHTGSCDGEHRVYWFKDSEDSHPGLIYTHGDRNGQCERKNTQTYSCVYELNMENLDESRAGIYYCAVVSCGHILFGNGTKLEITAQEGTLPPFVYFLSGALTVLLIFLTSYAILKTKSCKCKVADFQDRSAAASGQNAEAVSMCRAVVAVQQGTEDLHYAALSHNKTNKSRRQKKDTTTASL